jgi:1-hydroxycarotenoid 3,4-desaturase
LAYHNVFFGRDPSCEFGPIARGEMAQDPSLYVCAQDRSLASPRSGPERFEIIMNAAPLPARGSPLSDKASLCTKQMLSQLKLFHLEFQPNPSSAALTTPQHLAQRYPASQGAIYGRSPQSLLAPMLRPTAQTRIKGLYLAGGGAHPGPGIPMAALSGQHAAEMILNAPTLT